MCQQSPIPNNLFTFEINDWVSDVVTLQSEPMECHLQKQILASIPYDWTKAKLVLFSSVRIVLVPLLAMCAAPRGDPLLKNEEWAMVLSLFLGLSNGVFGSVPMIVAPSMVPDEQKELT
ncbi:equilibrative nucleoside transporter 4-like, partial [Centruroides sculpturatus]|uniref:equilibrative nucleoside transporter 4-like n=1 Tax=Centruroides sculpturatus TaxID=218467 RepID=UPI000C6CC492